MMFVQIAAVLSSYRYIKSDMPCVIGSLLISTTPKATHIFQATYVLVVYSITMAVARIWNI